VVVAVMHLSPNPVLSTVARLYVWVGRAMPPLVVILLWFNLALVFPRLGIGDLSADTNEILTPFVTAIFALTLAEAPYLSEIVRGGLLSVDPGQREAAQALGLRPGPILRGIVIPQAMRSILPALGNELVTVLKATALVSVVAAQELLTSVQNIYSVTFEVMELLIVATFWYLVLTSLAMVAQSRIERHFAKGMVR
jgi:polar amino acid transport system permease protein